MTDSNLTTDLSRAQRRPKSFYRPVGGIRRIGLVTLAVALAIAGIALAARPGSAAVGLALLGILSAIGLASLFAAAAGMFGLVRETASEASALVADTIDEGIAVSDRGGRVIYSNAAYTGFVGRAGRTPERAMTSNRDAADALYRLSQAAGQGKTASEEVRVAEPGGAGPRWLRLATQPLPTSAGDLTVWRVSDITGDAARQEDAFRDLQQIINYLDHAPAGFFSLGGDGRINYVNATLAGWLGLNLERTTGGTLQLGEIAPPEAAALLQDVKPVRSGSRIERVDTVLRRTDGANLPVRLLHRVTFDDRKRFMFSRTLVLERSDAPTDADGVRAVESRFLSFFGTAPIGIAMLDAGGGVDRCNPAFTRLFGVGSLKGRSLMDLVDEASRPALVTALQQGRLGKAASAPVEISFGGDRVGQIYLSVTDDTPGRNGALLVYAIDHTEQRRLEIQFAQSQKMQAVGQLAGGVAHDFNNVLTAIIGFSDLLLANHRPTDPSFQDIMNIRQNANRAAGLVRQLLAFSRRQTLRPEVIQVADVVAEVSTLLNRLLGERVDLNVSHGRDLWPVKTDINQFEQVVINLVVNARDAMPEGGTVTISTQNVTAEAVAEFDGGVMPAADYVEIAVADTGTGMDRATLDKIFEPFFSTKDVGKGTGLGLSTVYGIVKQTGGHIMVDSEVGRGTTFRIYLPRHIRAPEAETAPEAAPDGDAGPQAKADAPKPKPAPPKDLTGVGTILLVEDEDAVRAFASRALGAKGYTVLAAESGEEALALAEENEGGIDLVVSDVIMPEMDGPTLVKELQKRYGNLKIIFISGYAEAEFRKSLEDSDAFSFLPKPFSLKQLAEVVKEKMGEVRSPEG